MAFPKFEDWTPPWGDDDEAFDADKAKGLLYSLSKEKDGHKVKLEAANTAKKEAEDKLAQATKDLNEAQAAGNEKIVGELQTKVADLEGKLKKAERVNVALLVADEKGIPLAQADRLRGDTKEDLESDADDFLESFGAKGSTKNTEDEENEEEDGTIRRTPRGSKTPLGREGDRERDQEVNLDLVPRIT